MATGRGQLSSLELLPREANPIVAWAAGELANRARTQTDIYAEFVTRCQQLMAEHRGELEFRIPAFASFNRFSMRQARMSRRLDQTTEIVKVLAHKHDAKASDDLTIIAGEMIKAAVLFATGDGEDVMDGKELKALAEALRASQAAQNMSSERKAKEDKKLADRMGEAVDAVAKARGMTAETAEAIKAKLLGVAA
jgi:Protein of unknown function (DUF3486)